MNWDFTKSPFSFFVWGLFCDDYSASYQLSRPMTFDQLFETNDVGENQFECIIRLPYAFKMRQDYLSTSYLDQKYLPSERSETKEI